MRRTIPAAILVLLLASCGGERAEAPAPAAPATPPPSSSTSAPSSASSPSSPSSALKSVQEETDGTVLIAFTENGAARSLVGEEKSTGKRKYSLGKGNVIYEIKPADEGDGFKLRTADGKLRWKVKVAADKVKISDNEENRNPFELKVKDVNRVKVVAPGERELGQVRFAPNQIEVENAGGSVIFTTDATKPAGAYGVLLCDAIPEHERYILVAELLSRGK